MLYLIPRAGIAALVFARRRAGWIGIQDPGNERMREIAGNIQDGAVAFLAREYCVRVIFVAVVGPLLAISGFSVQ